MLVDVHSPLIRLVRPINSLTCPNSFIPRPTPSPFRLLGEFPLYSNFAARGREAVLSQILHGGPLAEARARRNLSAYQNEIKPGKINVSLSGPCILILSREKASFSLSARFRSSLCPFLSRSLSRALCFSINVPFHLVRSISLCLRAPLYRPSISGRKRKTKQFARSDRPSAGRLFSDRRTSRVKTAAQLQINAHPAGQKK